MPVSQNRMKVLITGANGFIGGNLQLHLAAREDVQVACFARANVVAQLPELLQGVDVVFHLAGVNRPQDPQEFMVGNANLTEALCEAVADVSATTGKTVTVICSSSIQAANDNPYADWILIRMYDWLHAIRANLGRVVLAREEAIDLLKRK